MTQCMGEQYASASRIEQRLRLRERQEYEISAWAAHGGTYVRPTPQYPNPEHALSEPVDIWFFAELVNAIGGSSPQDFRSELQTVAADQGFQRYTANFFLPPNNEFGFYDVGIHSNPQRPPKACQFCPDVPADIINFDAIRLTEDDGPADRILQVDYLSPEQTGPLIPRLDAVPDVITAEFRIDQLKPGQTNVGFHEVIEFKLLGLPSVNAQVFDLDSFALELDETGEPLNLFCQATDLPTSASPLLAGIEWLNNSFTLTINGDDPTTGQPFSYFYGQSVNTLTTIPEPAAGTGLLVLLGLGAVDKTR